MRKRKVLFVTEANFHPTGYSVYTKEVLSRLMKHPKLEVAELACFVGPESEELKNTPWKVYPNAPRANDEKGQALYNSSMSNKFGEFSFNSVVVDFMPDFVMDIRDWWMLEFVERSPFRPFFKWAIMPTVDAEPQNHQWIDTYSEADAVFAYSEFGRDTMLKQSNKINFVNITSPCASNKFFKSPDKNSLRKKYGVPEDAVIFGTVMRNQRRKLYPDLFKSFRIFLDNNPNANAYLYCHTTYPDVGWNIPELIKEYELSSRVLFTYKCRECNEIKARPYSDIVNFCNKCSKYSTTMVGISNRIGEEILNEVYNLFDVYIQWANSEGWGMPQLEAAYAGLPVISMDYSAMESLVANIKGVGVKPLSFYKELETGCNRAVPDNHELAKIMDVMYKDQSKRIYTATKCHDNARKIYNWDYTANKWADYFVNAEVYSPEKTWLSPARYFKPAQFLPKDIESVPVAAQLHWIFNNVLGMPELIGKPIWKRMVRDLISRTTLSSSIPGYYYNDYSHPDIEKRYEEFNIKKAYEACLGLRSAVNQWEEYRQRKISK